MFVPFGIKRYLGSGQLCCNFSQLCTWLAPILGMQGMGHLRSTRKVVLSAAGIHMQHHPSRQADIQDLGKAFMAKQVARWSAMQLPCVHTGVEALLVRYSNSCLI